MKITYFKGINFIGIKAGTGKDEIEIDFSKINPDKANDIIMLLGGNGSGKSTLQSILHPFRETFDNRRSFIMKGKDGYKEIHLEEGDNEYIVCHYYSSSSHKNKSYIKENGVELNENGNISTFVDLLKEKFNLTKEFFTIGKIGSNIEGFIGLSTSNRKSYINNFIPNIDEYLEAYEIVNDKFKNYNKDIKSLKKDINSLDTEDNLLIAKANVTNSLKLLNKNMELEKTKFDVDSNSLSSLEKELEEVPSDIEKIVEEKSINLSKINLKIEAYLNKYLNLKNYNLESIDSKIVENQTSISLTNPFIENIIKEIEKLKEEKNKSEEVISKNESLKLKTLEDFIKPSEIKVSIFNDNNELSIETKKFESAKSLLEEKGLEKFLQSENGYNKCKSEIESFFNTLMMIKDSFSYDVCEEIDVYKLEDYKKELFNNEKNLEQTRISLELLKSQIFRIEESYNKYSNIYSKRPSDCVSNSCPFISDAVNFMDNVYPTLDSSIMREKELSNEYKLSELLIEQLKDKISFISQLNKYILNDEFIQNSFFITNIIDFNDFNEIIKHSEKYQTISEEIISIMREYYNSNNNIIRLNSLIENNNNLLKTNIQKENLLKDYEEQIEYNKNKILSIEENIKKKSDKIEEYKNDIVIKTNTNKLLNNYKQNLNERKILQEEFDKYNNIYQSNIDKINKINSLKESIKQSTNKLKEYEKQKVLYDKDLNFINNQLFLLKTFSDKLKDIEGQIQNLEYVKEALDPKKGIPLIFMNNYLNVISASTNELLNKAYNGDFKIAFSVTPRDFLIKVYKSDGTVLNDISEASQGEIALTTIALSLAMMENLLKDCKYNILYLDEVDATLSLENRRIFLDLVNIQLEKNIDQCFIISHSGEYYSYPIDLILFKGNSINKEDEEFMSNKNIIWQIK